MKKNFIDFCRSYSSQEPAVFCVTGQMAAGKNFVCKKMEELNSNFVSIDLDKTVHEAINLSSEKIFAAFKTEAEEKGINLKNDDGSLNRRALGALIFPEPELLKRQEGIVYPKTIELTKAFIDEQRKVGKSVLINATVLFKTPELLDMCQKIIFVTAPFFTRLLRAKKRDSLPFSQILRRFYTQRNLLAEYKKSGKEIVVVQNR